MILLPDVNVLVSLSWPNHVFHAAARAWFDDLNGETWATTPVTEAGFVRVSCSPAVDESLTPPEALGLLDAMYALPTHMFLADDVPRVVDDRVDRASIAVRGQVTDAHLLAVAMRHGARLVTFDRGIGRLARDVTHLLLLPA